MSGLKQGSLCLAFQCSLPIFIVHMSLHTEELGKGTKCHTKSSLCTGFLNIHSTQPFCHSGRSKAWLDPAGSVQRDLALFTSNSRGFQCVLPALPQLTLCAWCGSAWGPPSILSHWAVGISEWGFQFFLLSNCFSLRA